jgi:hypothetical protein
MAQSYSVSELSSVATILITSTDDDSSAVAKASE